MLTLWIFLNSCVGSTVHVAQRVGEARPSANYFYPRAPRLIWPRVFPFHCSLSSFPSFLLLLSDMLFLTLLEQIDLSVGEHMFVFILARAENKALSVNQLISTRLKQAALDNIRYQTEPGAPIINHHSLVMAQIVKKRVPLLFWKGPSVNSPSEGAHWR